MSEVGDCSVPMNGLTASAGSCAAAVPSAIKRSAHGRNDRIGFASYWAVVGLPASARSRFIGASEDIAALHNLAVVLADDRAVRVFRREDAGMSKNDSRSSALKPGFERGEIE